VIRLSIAVALFDHVGVASQRPGKGAFGYDSARMLRTVASTGPSIPVNAIAPYRHHGELGDLDREDTAVEPDADPRF
jgi:hypothetical protein